MLCKQQAHTVEDLIEGASVVLGMRQQVQQALRLPGEVVRSAYKLVEDCTHHPGTRKDIPAESNTISVFYLRPLIFQLLVLSLVHSESLCFNCTEVNGQSDWIITQSGITRA